MVSNTIEVRVPDLGDFHDVPVIEVLVKPGDTIRKDDPLVTLESDKASMEVPASEAGVVKDVRVNVGDKVSKGSVIVALEPLRQAQDDSSPVMVSSSNHAPQEAQGDSSPVMVSSSNHAPQEAQGETIELTVPDLGDFKDVPVIDVLVKPGDRVTKEQPLVTLESDKASMDVPASTDGTIADVRVKTGDKVSRGTVIATLQPLRQAQDDSALRQAQGDSAPVMVSSSNHALRQAQDDNSLRQAQGDSAPRQAQGERGVIHASPAIRRFARELGVDLHGIEGSGPHGRVMREDVQRFVKRALSGAAPAASAGGASFAGLPPWPKVDFAQFGAIERKPLPRIKKISGPNLHRNWLQIPHITNYDEADVTELEAFRVEINADPSTSAGGQKVKLTMLAFLIKACVAALQRFPEFNSSLEGDELIYKQYYNIGFAADTPNGLVVPVLKHADGKGLLEIARESAELAGKARDGKLGMSDMQGGTFTISSIGGIGGTQFTQIINAPEVAILGATRASVKPVWDGNAFVPRTMLPISVSYDHRVIDGAGAARFLVYLASLLKDFRRVLL
jgi:pyruvate dehydrogenase E2 component (dihydrolipoamide acetyltransferase)